MNERRPAPPELNMLVAASLPPRVIVELDWWAFDFGEWRFRLSWFGKTFVLHIPGEHWDDRLTESISVWATFGAPRPEGTLGGSRLFLSLQRSLSNDSARYRFSVFRRSAEAPQSSTVVVTGSATGMLLTRCGRHEGKAFEAALSLWLLKDLVDQGRVGEDLVVHGSNLESFLKRAPISDGESRRYAGLKIHQTYQVAGTLTSVTFSWLDFGYLGIAEDDFQRAVSLRHGKDWSIKGLTITPTADFLERLDSESPAERKASPEGSSAMMGVMRDLFVSYASEDKEILVRPLVEALTLAGMTAWFDDYELLLGDSLRKRIDDGLRNSRHGLVVLSHSFFKKDWPQKELDGLFSLMGRDRRIMPIWHGLTKEDVARYSPVLAGVVAIKSSEGVAKIVEVIQRALWGTSV